MPSPFPGIDPYLERPEFWPDFHQQFIISLRGHLNQRLPAGYFAGVSVDIVLREPSAADRLLRRPDVAVRHRGNAERASQPERPATALAAPAYATLPDLVEDKRLSIEIRSSGRGDAERLVTHVELLSPSNKSSDWLTYSDKRRALCRSDANFVEIDLLRGGNHLSLDPMPDCDGYVLVHRPADEQQVAIWPILLRSAMPIVPIPLLPGDSPVEADLQAVMDRAYDEAGYGRTDSGLYAAPPEPPLSDEDAAWAESLLASAEISRR